MRWLPRLAMATMLSGGLATAQEKAVCEVPIVQALHNGDDGREPTIDPKIDRLRPYLLRAPFIAWRDFKLIERKDLEVPLHGAQSFTLPNGRDATLAFQEHSSGPGDHRLTLRLSIDDPKKKSRMLDTTFVLDEGGVVLHVGQHYQGGILILGVSCKTH
jgi:hypothetical protein